ncbi:MAG: hypothetical protein RQ752_11095 [Thermohalobaculum sp.]|nr:hypothetical protein [Thermohalobaculum sp.]
MSTARAAARRRAAADAAFGVRKARDGALAVPLIGFILLMPPVAQIFAIDGRIAGVPVTVGYVFGVWLLLIVGARRIGARILETETVAEATGALHADARAASAGPAGAAARDRGREAGSEPGRQDGGGSGTATGQGRGARD